MSRHLLRRPARLPLLSFLRLSSCWPSPGLTLLAALLSACAHGGGPGPTGVAGPTRSDSPSAALMTPELGTPAPERAKGFQEVRSTRAELEESFAPQRWAVVIGVPSYTDPTWTRLRFPVSDAKELARVLREPRFGGFHRVLALTSPEATTREGILFELRRLRNELRREDTLVVYFSGHGSLELTREGIPSFYLAASDTRANDLFGTAIELSALRDFLDGLRPQRKVMILDNCFAGEGKSQVATVTRKRLQTFPSPFEGAAAVQGRSEALLMASTLGGVAQEDDRLGHGTYTYYLLQALTASSGVADANQDGAVTVYEAHDFARLHTVEHTRRTQVPEGYFRVLGQAEIYLSGTPSPELAKAAALVYAYALERGSAVSLTIDGRPKGTFPRTIPVEPGRRQVTVVDASGTVLADGPMHFTKGRTYALPELLEELQGYRRFLGMELGGTAQVGPSVELWGSTGSRLGVISGYRVRSGELSGLTFSVALGVTPIQDGTWKEVSRDASRLALDLGAQLVVRRRLGPLLGGVGWQAQGIYTTAANPEGTGVADPEVLRLLDRWLTLSTGPVLWQGFPLQRNVVLGLEEQAAWFFGSFDGTGPRSSFQGSISLGVEVGF